MTDRSHLRARIQTSCKEYIEAFEELEDMLTLIVKPSQITSLCHVLHSDTELQFNFLSDMCGVDYLPRQPRFDLVYHLFSLPRNHRLRIKIRLDEGQSVPSVTSVWQTANWHEREAFDMYGIPFDNHPDLTRIFMWDEFQGYPLRKDFPLRGYKDELNPNGEEPQGS